MKNKFVFIAVLICCINIMNAQTPCEKTFLSAKKLFKDRAYDDAKAQFQKVIDYCDDNKELADEYIKLCNEFNRLAGEREMVNEKEEREVDSLKRRISQLEKQNEEFNNTFLKARNNLDKQQSIITEKSDSINYWKGRYYSNNSEKESLIAPLRSLGNDLNNCLESYWVVRIRMGEPLENYDTINDANGLIEAMSRNIKLASKKKKN